MSGRRALEGGTLLLAGAFYLVNKGLLIPHTSGAAGWFLACYANDLFAGAAMVAWLDLLMGVGRLRLLGWRWICIYLLACGAVWECLAPLWKAGAVFDPWDLAAYLAGGLVFRLVASRPPFRSGPPIV